MFQVITAVTMGVGIWNLILYVIGLGSLTWLFSPVLMSAYTCGAGIHITSSQIKGLFGLTVPRRSGPLKLIYVGIHFGCQQYSSSKLIFYFSDLY